MLKFFVSLALLVASFFLSHMMYAYYSQIPFDDISTADRLFAMAWDVGVTVFCHGLCAYFLSNPTLRFKRAWAISVLVGILWMALECLVRCICLGFGEPIFRMVAGMITDSVFIFLPLVGTGAGLGWRVCAGKWK